MAIPSRKANIERPSTGRFTGANPIAGTFAMPEPLAARLPRYPTCRHYTCLTNKARQGESGCKGRSIPIDKLDDLIADHLRTLARRVGISDKEVRIMGPGGKSARNAHHHVRRKIDAKRRAQVRSEVAEGVGFEPTIRF